MLQSRLPALRAPAQTRLNSTKASIAPGAAGANLGDFPKRASVPPRSTHATYHPGGYGVSEGLKRARRPYLVRNVITGGLIMGFTVGVYFYSISKVKQDDFSDLADIRAPTAETTAPVTTETDHQHKV